MAIEVTGALIWELATRSNLFKLLDFLSDKRKICPWLWLIGILLLPVAQATEVYLAPEQFLAETFGGNIPKPEALWIGKDMARQAEAILGHAPAQLRQRYWKERDKTVWILEEIGKEELITAGFVVAAGKIAQVKVLVYRESRGWEIHYPAFLKQYEGIGLQPDYQLNRTIDGISGATYSVRAMGRMARLALYYDHLSQEAK